MRAFLAGIAVAAGISAALQPALTPEPEIVERVEYRTVDFIREVRVPVEVGGRFTEQELDLMAITMWGEARGDGPMAMRAVGHVILNRLNAGNPRRYGATLSEVIQKPYQFSVWNDDDPNRRRMLRMMSVIQGGTGEDFAAWLMAREIARQIMEGRSEDPTNGALYYHTLDVEPGWSRHATSPMVLASHVFYQDATR